MQSSASLGYVFTACLYFMAWWNPEIGSGKGLVQWASFMRLGPTEFLTLHASTLLGAAAFAAQSSTSVNDNWPAIFWILSAVYAIFGAGAYLYHRDFHVLLGFYLMLAIRGWQLLSLRTPDIDVMRSQIVKNFAMTVPMMGLIFALSTSDDGLTPWQISFLSRHSTGLVRIWRGRALLFVVVYYLIWAVVEWKWPFRMKG